EHVVGAPRDAEAPARSAAGAGPGVGDGEDVARPVADQGLALLDKMGTHQLPRRALPDRQALARRGIQQLDEHAVTRVIMEIARVLALAANDRHDLGEPEIGVADLEPPGRLRRCAEARVVEPRLAAEEAEPEAERARLAPHLLAQHLLEERGIGRRAMDPGDAKLGDGLEQLPGAAYAEGHGRRPAR